MADGARKIVRSSVERTFGVQEDTSYTASTISAAAADNSINDSANGFITAGFSATESVGCWVDIDGFTGDTSNNTQGRIVSVAAGKIVLSGCTLADDAAGESVTVQGPVFHNMRVTDSSLNQTSGISTSDEIDGTRQVTSVSRTSVAADGSIPFNLSYSDFDEKMKFALQAASWSDEVSNTDITYAAVASGNKITDSGSALVSDGFLANYWYKIAGFTTTTNNGYAYCTSVAAGEAAFSGITFTDEAAGDTVTITMLGRVTNGTTEWSETLEVENSDLTNVFSSFSGMSINQLDINIPTAENITGTLVYMGKEETSNTSTDSVANVSPSSNSVMVAAESDTTIYENFTSGLCVTDFTFSISNNLREQRCVGTVGPRGLGSGKISVTGSFNRYFEDTTVLAKYLAFTTTALTVLCEDADGNAYIFHFPEVKLTQNNHNDGTVDADVMEQITFEAFKDQTEGITMAIYRYSA